MLRVYLTLSYLFRLVRSVSYIFGLIAMLAGLMGVPLGSFLGQKLRLKYQRADPIVCGFGLLLSTPLMLAALFIAKWNTTACFVVVFFGQLFLNLNWAIVADILLVCVWFCLVLLAFYCVCILWFDTHFHFCVSYSTSLFRQGDRLQKLFKFYSLTPWATPGLLTSLVRYAWPTLNQSFRPYFYPFGWVFWFFFSRFLKFWRNNFPIKQLPSFKVLWCITRPFPVLLATMPLLHPIVRAPQTWTYPLLTLTLRPCSTLCLSQ